MAPHYERGKGPRLPAVPDILTGRPPDGEA
jgi:hypothetical protein